MSCLQNGHESCYVTLIGMTKMTKGVELLLLKNIPHPFQQNEEQKRILNVGCGGSTYGTDFIDLYPLRPEVKVCNADKDIFPFPDETFDEVYSSYLFEHLTNVSHYMTEVWRVLKPHGKIVIITDNAALHGLFGRVHHGRYEEDHADHPDDRHYALFTPTNLKNFLVKFGFRINEVGYCNGSWRIKLLYKKLSPHVFAVGTKEI